jgi:phosphoribosyl-ATP pyrophosphohydrolase/phosphoribosyl-AMP cyclohydrolase
LTVDLSKLKFDSGGLIPVIIQDAENGEVLMMAWMNDEAIRKTADSGLTHFYSRSRQTLWQKGETSGHVQSVREILYDCDADCLLIKVEQTVAACHTGYRSCFHKTLDGKVRGVPAFNAEEVYGVTGKNQIIERLYQVILDRKNKPQEDSYTRRLLSGGAGLIGSKIREEVEELLEAAAGKNPDEIVREAADLTYHALVILADTGVTPGEVKQELTRRFGVGGHKEKAGRHGSGIEGPNSKK